jgi:hypothetical protein
MDNEIVKRLVWSGMLTAATALAGLLATRAAAFAWRRLFDEDPPE